MSPSSFPPHSFAFASLRWKPLSQILRDAYSSHRAYCGQSPVWCRNQMPMFLRIPGNGGGAHPISRTDAFNFINDPAPPRSTWNGPRGSSSQQARSEMSAEVDRARAQMAMAFDQHSAYVEQMTAQMAAVFEQHRAIGQNRYQTAAGAMDANLVAMMEHHRVMTDRAVNSAMQSMRLAGGRMMMPHVVMVSPAGHQSPYGVVYPQGPAPTVRSRVSMSRGKMELPQDVLTASTLRRLNRDTPDCSICLEKFRVKDVVTRLPCTHVYHSNCIREWLTQSGSCPVCKHPVS